MNFNIVEREDEGECITSYILIIVWCNFYSILGIYQCFAENVGGEAYKSGYLTVWNPNSYKNIEIDDVNCYALDLTKLLVSYNVINTTVSFKIIILLYKD